MNSLQKTKLNAEKEENPGNLQKGKLKKYKLKLKTFKLGRLIVELAYESSRPALYEYQRFYYEAIVDEIDQREKKLNILWEREQEIDRLNAAPYGHGDNCICPKCYNTKVRKLKGEE